MAKLCAGLKVYPLDCVPAAGSSGGIQSLARSKQGLAEELLPCAPFPNHQQCLGLGLQPLKHPLESKNSTGSKGSRKNLVTVQGGQRGAAKNSRKERLSFEVDLEFFPCS